MFNLQSYSETGRNLLSIEHTSRATSRDSQTEANEWDPLPWGTCRGKSLSSCLPLQSITLQTVLLWEISTQIFLAKAIQLCPPVKSPLYCRKGKEKKGLPFHCLLRSSWHGLRESRAGIQLILPLSKEMCAVTTLPVLILCDFSALLTNWKGWPPNWTEVLSM